MAGHQRASTVTLALFLGVTALTLNLPAVAQTQNTPPLVVDAVTVTLQSEARVVERYAGLALPRRESQLGFEAGGRVATVAVDVGDRVTADDALASLDLRVLDAQIAAAEASLRQAEANAQLATLTLTRQRELVTRGNTSQQALDDAQARAAANEAAVEAARAQLEQLKVRRDLSTLTAPYDGVITERYLDEGSVASPGAPVLDIVEVDRIEVRVGLPEAQARGLSVGALYAFESESGQSVQARLRAVTQVVDRSTRTVTTVFDISEGQATPGEVLRLRLEGTAPGEGVWTPLTALSEGRRGLWTVMALSPSEDGQGLYTVERRYVEIVHLESERAYVRGAVADGDLYIATGLDRVSPGQTVRVSNGGAPQGARLAERQPE